MYFGLCIIHMFVYIVKQNEENIFRYCYECLTYCKTLDINMDKYCHGLFKTELTNEHPKTHIFLVNVNISWLKDLKIFFKFLQTPKPFQNKNNHLSKKTSLVQLSTVSDEIIINVCLSSS